MSLIALHLQKILFISLIFNYLEFYFCILFIFAGSSWPLGHFSSCGEWRLLFVMVCRLLPAVVSLAVERGPRECGLQESRCLGSVVMAPGL